MTTPPRVKRSDWRFARTYLMTHPGVSLALGGVFLAIGVALRLNLFGHSAIQPTGEIKSTLGAIIAWIVAAITLYYGSKGIYGQTPSTDDHDRPQDL